MSHHDLVAYIDSLPVEIPTVIRDVLAPDSAAKQTLQVQKVRSAKATQEDCLLVLPRQRIVGKRSFADLAEEKPLVSSCGTAFSAGPSVVKRLCSDVTVASTVVHAEKVMSQDSSDRDDVTGDVAGIGIAVAGVLLAAGAAKTSTDSNQTSQKAADAAQCRARENAARGTGSLPASS